MNDLAALIDERAEVLYLEPAADDTIKLHWPRAGESFAAYFHFPDELPLLVDVLKSIGVARLHFHHVHLNAVNPAVAAEYITFFKALNSTPLSDWMMATPLNGSVGCKSL